MDFDEVLVEDDIQEEENAIKDIRDFSGIEKSAKTQSSLNHCNFFLKSYCAKEKIKRQWRLEDIPFGGIDGKGNEFWGKMIASFVHYLGATAKHRFNPENEGLSWETASQYASSVKQYLVTNSRPRKGSLSSVTNNGVF